MSSGNRLSPIRNGTVIDHLPAKSALKILEILDLDYEQAVTVAINTNSTKRGKKDLIFIENKILNEKEISKIGLLAHGSTWNIIEEEKVVMKKAIEYPEDVIDLLVCPNPKCITSNENIPTRFSIDKENGHCTCDYCNKELTKTELFKHLK